MLSTVYHFQIFKPGSVNGRCGGTANSNKRTNQKHQNNIKLNETILTGNDKRKHCAHQKHANQQDEYYSTYGLSFSQKILRCNPLCNH